MPLRTAPSLLPTLLLSALAAACSSTPPSTVDPAPQPVRSAPANPVHRSTVNTEGWAWIYRSSPPAALFGPPASEAVLVARCSPEGPGRVQITVHSPAPAGGSSELVIEGNGHRRMVPMGSMESELASGPIWSGHSDIRDVERPFLGGDGPVVFRIEGGPTWAVPDPLPVRSLFEACAR